MRPEEPREALSCLPLLCLQGLVSPVCWQEQGRERCFLFNWPLWFLSPSTALFLRVTLSIERHPYVVVLQMYDLQEPLWELLLGLLGPVTEDLALVLPCPAPPLTTSTFKGLCHSIMAAMPRSLSCWEALLSDASSAAFYCILWTRGRHLHMASLFSAPPSPSPLPPAQKGSDGICPGQSSKLSTWRPRCPSPLLQFLKVIFWKPPPSWL